MTATLAEPETTVRVPVRYRWAPPLLAVAAVACWTAFVRPVDPGTLGSYGLVTALHPGVLVGIALLSLAFCAELRSPRPRTVVLLGMCVLAVLCLYGLQPLVEPAARLPVAWLHAGWSGQIAQHGQILHDFDARFSWPAFFAAVAWFGTESGTADATGLLAWAPPVCTGVAAIGVHAVATAVLGRGRAPWLATWIFLVVDWVEQDYFSPQAVSYLLYVAALALVFRWLCRPGLATPVGRARIPVPDRGSRRRLGASFGLVLLICALSPTHQVTPFALALLLVLLAFAGRLSSPWLAVLAVLIPLTWLVLGASEYWLGHLDVLFGGIGDVSGSVRQNVGQRFTGDLGRSTVLGVRVALTGLVLLAAAGSWWRMRGPDGRRPVLLGILAVAPFVLLALQSYGGEMLLRSLLYALPLLCTVAGSGAARLLARTGRPGAALAGVLALALAGASLGLVTARGGNDAYVAFRSADVRAVRTAYRLARPGQRIAALTAYVPLNWQRVGRVGQVSLERQCVPGPREAACVRRIAPDFLILNRAQDNYGVIVLGLPRNWTRTVAARLRASGEYRIRLHQGDTVLLAHVSTGGGR